MADFYIVHHLIRQRAVVKGELINYTRNLNQTNLNEITIQ